MTARDAEFGARSNFSKLFNDIDTLRAKLAALEGQGLTTGQALSAGMMTAGTAVSRFGRTLTTRLTLPLLGAAAVAGKVFIGFEQNLARAGLVAGATNEELEQLRQTAIKLGVETRFTPEQAAQGMYELASAGLNVNEVIGTLPNVLNFATAASLDLGEAAEVTAGIMNAFGIDADKTGHTVDVLTKLINVSTFHAEELGEAFAQAGVLGSTANQSLEDVAATLAVLRNQGLPAAMAGTALRFAMQQLQAPTDEAAEVLDKVGISIRNVDGTIRPLPELVREFASRLDDANPQFKTWRTEMGLGAVAARDQALSALFGARGQQAFSLAMNASIKVMRDGTEVTLEGADAIAYLSEQMKTTEGVTDDFAATMRDTLGGQLTELKGSVETLLITFAEKFAPAVKDFVKTTLIPLVNGWREWIELHPETVAMLGKVLAFLTLVGPALLVIGGTLRTVGFLLAPFKVLTGLLPMLSLVSPALLAIVAVLVGAFASSEDFRESVFEIVKKLGELAIQVAPAVIAIFETMKTLFGAVGDALAPIVGFIAQLVDLSGTIITIVLDVVTGSQFGKVMAGLAGLALLSSKVRGLFTRHPLIAGSLGFLTAASSLLNQDFPAGPESRPPGMDLTQPPAEAYMEAVGGRRGGVAGLSEAATALAALNALNVEARKDWASTTTAEYAAAAAAHEEAEALEETAVRASHLSRQQQTLADRLWAARTATLAETEAQATLADVLRAAADPAFAAVRSFQQWQTEVAKLAEVRAEFGEESVEYANQELALAAAAIEAFGDLNDLKDPETLRVALEAIAAALSTDVDHVTALLEKLGILVDGKYVVDVGVNLPPDPTITVHVRVPHWYIDDIGGVTQQGWVYMHSGGRVPLPKGMEGLFMLQGGEYVLTDEDMELMSRAFRGLSAGVPSLNRSTSIAGLSESLSTSGPQSVQYVVNNPRSKETEESLRDIRMRQALLGPDAADMWLETARPRSMT